MRSALAASRGSSPKAGQLYNCRSHGTGRPSLITRLWAPSASSGLVDGGRVVTTVCATPSRSSASVSSWVCVCMPPIGSNRAPRPAIAESGGWKTEQSLSTFTASPLLIHPHPQFVPVYPVKMDSRGPTGCRVVNHGVRAPSRLRINPPRPARTGGGSPERGRASGCWTP
jgi:hypothetical protein